MRRPLSGLVWTNSGVALCVRFSVLFLLHDVSFAPSVCSRQFHSPFSKAAELSWYCSFGRIGLFVRFTFGHWAVRSTSGIVLSGVLGCYFLSTSTSQF